MDEDDDNDDDDISLIFRAPDLPLSLILLPSISPAARPYEFCECVLSSAPDLFPQNFFSLAARSSTFLRRARIHET